MAAVQVIMLMIMLEQVKLIWSPFKCPDNLLDVGVGLVSVFVISVIIYPLIIEELVVNPTMRY